MSIVDEIEQNIDIIDLVGKYTKLKKTGASYKALCPFPGHSEKTPSFVASPSKQIAYCFGCHKGGGPIKFIMDMENCDFRESVQILGNILGREIKGFESDSPQYELQKNIYSLYKDALSFYKNALEEFPEVKKYIFERGISQETLQKFLFGYSKGGNELYQFLKQKNYSDDLIEESHVFQDFKRKKDYFIGRLVFPIQNQRGDVVAFAGRILGSGEPKYINSPASAIYDKSALLYGLYFARKTIHERDQIIICEGYMDTISLHQGGFMQAVGISGTALTEKHLPIIARLTKKIFLCFDSDTAGKKATLASLEILKNKGFEVRIIQILGGYKDPDELLKAGGNFQECIDNALSPISFAIQESKYDLSSIDDKKKFLKEILEMIQSYSENIERDMYLKELSLKSNTPLHILYEMFQQKRDSKFGDQKKNIFIAPEDYIIAYGFLDKTYLDFFTEKIILKEQLPSKIERIFSEEKDFLNTLSFEEKNYYQALALELQEKNWTGEEHQKNIEKLSQSIDKNTIKRLSEELKQKMSSGNTESFEAYSKLMEIAKKYQLK